MLGPATKSIKFLRSLLLSSLTLIRKGHATVVDIEELEASKTFEEIAKVCFTGRESFKKNLTQAADPSLPKNMLNVVR